MPETVCGPSVFHGRYSISELHNCQGKRDAASLAMLNRESTDDRDRRPIIGDVYLR